LVDSQLTLAIMNVDDNDPCHPSIDGKNCPKHTVHMVNWKDVFEFVSDPSLHNTVKVAGATGTVAAH
jgi:hypothetical protein